MCGSSVIVKALFRDCFGPDCCLVSTGGLGIRDSTVIASGIFVRGKGVPISDVNANVTRLQNELRMPSWNREGFKTGLCETNALEQNISMLTLNNSDCINNVFGSLSERFNKLWRRKAMVHHYTQYCEEAEFAESIGSLQDLMREYAEVGNRGAVNAGHQRLWDVNTQTATRKVAF